MIKIIESNKTIYLIDNQSDFKRSENAVIVSVQSADEMISNYNKLAKKKKLQEIYFFNRDLKQLYNYFSAMFRIIEAAGGLVKNKKNEWLFIFRNGKWDLPKGKIENGEGIKAAAIREVEEECGISNVAIIKELLTTYHTYFLKEKAILKRTYWFEMSCAENSKLVPQTEEGITEVKWLAKNNLKPVFENTYESVMDILKSEI